MALTFRRGLNAGGTVFILFPSDRDVKIIKKSTLVLSVALPEARNQRDIITPICSQHCLHAKEYAVRNAFYCL
jgi:hypothetical protein